MEYCIYRGLNRPKIGERGASAIRIVCGVWKVGCCVVDARSSRRNDQSPVTEINLSHKLHSRGERERYSYLRGCCARAANYELLQRETGGKKREPISRSLCIYVRKGGLAFSLSRPGYIRGCAYLPALFPKGERREPGTQQITLSLSLSPPRARVIFRKAPAPPPPEKTTRDCTRGVSKSYYTLHRIPISHIFTAYIRSQQLYAIYIFFNVQARPMRGCYYCFFFFL